MLEHSHDADAGYVENQALEKESKRSLFAILKGSHELVRRAHGREWAGIRHRECVSAWLMGV